MRADRWRRVAAEPAVASDCASGIGVTGTDWAGDRRTFVLLWGLPGGVMMAAALLHPMPRAMIWIAMLLWMSGACLQNARRCGRTHCRFTGPFFILMAGLVAAHALGILPLGAHGWGILGGATVIGAGTLWWASERIWGAFTR